jgi:hypothetical protein
MLHTSRGEQAILNSDGNKPIRKTRPSYKYNIKKKISKKEVQIM